MPEIIFDDVHFSYGSRRKQRHALRGVALSISGGVTGIVGPNGAGKTTLFRLILGLLKPTRGRILMDGLDPETYRVRHGLGFIPEQPAFPSYLKVDDFLAGLGAIARRGSYESSVFAVPGVEDLADRRLGDLSLGQKRRVELAAAAIGDPPILLLDEPTNGLDPNGIRWLRDACRSLAAPSRVLLVASHHLDELQRTVDKVVVLSQGAVRGTWTRDDAVSRFGSFDALFEQSFAATS